MFIYHYHHESREYLGSTPADLDPLETELAGEPRYLLPGCATFVAPPEVPTGHAARWTGEVWELVEDHRGEIWFEPATRQEITIQELGPIPPDLVAEMPPPPPEPVAELYAAKLAEIQAAKCRARDGGFVVDGVRFDSDLAARTAYAELAIAMQQDPAFSTRWRASEGQWVTMDAALFQQVYAAGRAHIESCFAWQEVREQEIEAALALAETDEAAARAAIAAIVPAYTLPE